MALIRSLAVLALLVGLSATCALAEDEKPAPVPAGEVPPVPPKVQGDAPADAKAAPPVATLASDAEAAAALEVFETAFKAKDLKGDDRISERVYALKTLGEVQHPSVVERIFKETRNRDAHVRTEAVLQLGRQAALPASAGRRVVEAFGKNKSDEMFSMAALASIGELQYLGATDTLRALMKHKDFAVVHNALDTIAALKDVRMIESIWQLLKELKLEAGASWDGVEVNYDTGTAGDGDQKMAEKIGKAAEAANGSKGKSAARSMRDLGPIALRVMKALTGEEFTGSITAREWMEKNKAWIEEQQAALDAREKEQR